MAFTGSAQVDTIGRTRKASARAGFPLFLVGTNSRGNWVVRDRKGENGGLFVGQAAAIKFALSANGNNPKAIRMVSGVLELDIAEGPRASSARKAKTAPVRLVA